LVWNDNEGDLVVAKDHKGAECTIRLIAVA
jgi:hypothetical protein